MLLGAATSAIGTAAALHVFAKPMEPNRRRVRLLRRSLFERVLYVLRLLLPDWPAPRHVWLVPAERGLPGTMLALASFAAAARPQQLPQRHLWRLWQRLLRSWQRAPCLHAAWLYCDAWRLVVVIRVPCRWHLSVLPRRLVSAWLASPATVAATTATPARLPQRHLWRLGQRLLCRPQWHRAADLHAAWLYCDAWRLVILIRVLCK